MRPDLKNCFTYHFPSDFLLYFEKLYFATNHTYFYSWYRWITFVFTRHALPAVGLKHNFRVCWLCTPTHVIWNKTMNIRRQCWQSALNWGFILGEQCLNCTIMSNNVYALILVTFPNVLKSEIQHFQVHCARAQRQMNSRCVSVQIQELICIVYTLIRWQINFWGLCGDRFVSKWPQASSCLSYSGMYMNVCTKYFTQNTHTHTHTHTLILTVSHWFLKVQCVRIG